MNTAPRSQVTNDTPQDQAVTPPPAAPFTTDGHLVFVSGQVGADSQWRPVGGSVAGEIRQTLQNLSATLHSAGCGLQDVLHVRTYLADMEDFASFNEVWGEFFPTNPPARTTVQAGLHPPFRVECEAVAAIPTTAQATEGQGQ